MRGAVQGVTHAHEIAPHAWANPHDTKKRLCRRTNFKMYFDIKIGGNIQTTSVANNLKNQTKLCDNIKNGSSERGRKNS
jgi:hypothetical protein